MRRLFVFVIVANLLSAVTSAQSTSSGITGRVRSGDDYLEAVNVQLGDVSHGGVSGTITNRYGIYSFSGLRPGTYTVSFSCIGYKTVSKYDVRVSLGEEYTLDVELLPEDNILDAVDITAEYTHFNDTKTGQTYSIRNDRLELLPSIDRSLLDYTRLSIYNGMSNSMAGRDGRMTVLNIDGAALSNSFGLSSNLPGGGNPVSVDAIDEVQVVIAPYDVRQSNFTGGGINAVTKSGSNIFKATAYTYQSNEHFRGNSVAGNSLGERKKNSKSVYGITVGGPVLRDRLFFFVNAEYETRPGPVSEWRLSDNGLADGAAMTSRVTASDMAGFSNALSKYGYDAGTTDLDAGGLTNGKILARIDWNISDVHNLMVRYNYTVNSEWCAPDPDFTVGTGTASSRISMNSYVFRNNCYKLRDVAWSAVAELNSNFSRFSNHLLLTTSMVGNDRTSESAPFPHVDIMKDGDAFMSGGYELCSYGTGNRMHSYNIRDYISRTVLHSSLTAGISYEYQKVATNYMTFANGYYKYASLEDFEKNNAPVAFGYTYAYEGVDDPASKSSIGQGSAFVQSETKIGQRLRVTYGLRADLTGFYQPVRTNRKYYDLTWRDHFIAKDEPAPEGWTSPRFDTGRWPDASVMLSPRIGFNWNVFGDGRFTLRGGAGLFAGRIPMVFLTNLPNSSNTLQNTVGISDENGIQGLDFMYDKAALRQYMADNHYPLDADNDLPVKNAAICGVEENFKLPQVLKTSVAADWTLPVHFPATITVEGIYNKDINAVYVRNLNLSNSGNFNSFSGADDRLDYRQSNVGLSSPLLYDNVTGGAMMLCNTSRGYSWSIAATVQAEPIRNLKFEVSYIHQDAKSVSDMNASSLYSAWKKMLTVNDPNEEVLRTSGYVIPDRILADVTYTIGHGSRFNMSIGLFYSGSRTGRYSYMYMNDMNGDGAMNDLIYIPASKDEVIFVENGKYTAEQQQEAFWNYVCNDVYLSSHKGQYAGANDALMPWLNRFDLRIAETFRVGRTGDKANSHKVQVSLDLMNVGNLLCDKWGVQKTASGCNDGKILKYVGIDSEGRPNYTLYSSSTGLLTNAFEPLQSTSNCWYMQLGIRYFFN